MMTLISRANSYILGWPVAWPLAIAASVVLGEPSWSVVLCTAVKRGAHVLSHSNWQVATETSTTAVMLWFAIRLMLHFP